MEKFERIFLGARVAEKVLSKVNFKQDNCGLILTLSGLDNILTW